jgi:hypothetical protein
MEEEMWGWEKRNFCWRGMVLKMKHGAINSVATWDYWGNWGRCKMGQEQRAGGGLQAQPRASTCTVLVQVLVLV